MLMMKVLVLSWLMVLASVLTATAQCPNCVDGQRRALLLVPNDVNDEILLEGLKIIDSQRPRSLPIQINKYNNSADVSALVRQQKEQGDIAGIFLVTRANSPALARSELGESAKVPQVVIEATGKAVGPHQIFEVDTGASSAIVFGGFATGQLARSLFDRWKETGK